jgi:hypothetical protein
MISTARVISLSLHRAGTVPVFNPPYHTPPVYIFSVLEIDVALICASVPIFWPLVQNMSLAKILVVNEITVRTERRSEAIDLIGGSKAEFGGGDMEDGRASKISVRASKQDPDRPHFGHSRLGRTLSRQHRQKPSTSSSGKAIHMATRSSHDSQRDLHLSESASSNSLTSIARPDMSLAPSDGTVARYADKYMQEWAVPDFDKGAPPAPAGSPYANSPERVQVPFDPIRASEK